jgi:phage-related protein
VRSVEFYRTESNRCPVEQFLDSLPDKHAQKVAWVLRLVERLERVPKQYLKKLVGTDQIWEIRAHIGGSSYRFLGFFDGPVILILTSAFSKKQQKTPVREIELAEARRQDYLHRRPQP